MVRMIKNAIATDNFLGTLHTLLLMDDTVVLATSREMCEAKLKVVIQYCQEFGMDLNIKKTKYFVINGTQNDKIPLDVEGTTISYSSQYLYLGAWFTDSGKMSDIVQLHERANQATVNKFSIFCAANTQMPFIYKKLVFDAAVTSSLLYSAESWLTDSIRPIENQYNQLVRCLLGVRRNISIELCLIEAGIPPVKHVIAKRRCKFVKSKLELNDAEQPFIFAFRLCNEGDTQAYRFMSRNLAYNTECNPFSNLENFIIGKASHGTKYKTYKDELNRSLEVHPVYKTNIFIPDHERTSFSRIRLISHNLKIETGRWSRIPREHRVCQCDDTQLQTEAHVLISCTLTDNIRLRYPMLDFRTINSLLSEASHIRPLCTYVYEVLRIYS